MMIIIIYSTVYLKQFSYFCGSGLSFLACSHKRGCIPAEEDGTLVQLHGIRNPECPTCALYLMF